MQNDTNRLFAHLIRKEPRASLYGRIRSRIELEQRKTSVYARIVFFGVVACGGAIALVPALRELYAEFTQSGFAQFITLLFSDTGTIAMYWQDFLMSLAESLPAVGIAGVAMSVFAILLPLRFLLNDIGFVRDRTSLVSL